MYAIAYGPHAEAAEAAAIGLMSYSRRYLVGSVSSPGAIIKESMACVWRRGRGAAVRVIYNKANSAIGTDASSSSSSIYSPSTNKQFNTK